MKQVKVEWCENWIRKVFEKKLFDRRGGIEVNFFWKLAEKSGLWERGAYETPMSEALEKLVAVDWVVGADGNCKYTVFRAKFNFTPRIARRKK